MSIDFQKLRLSGVYQQKNPEDLMVRVKIPGGLLSAVQAREIAAISSDFGRGILHLTSRGSFEFHWLRVEQLEGVLARLNGVGLTTKGACGGAVRGISCSTTFAPGYGRVQHLAERLNRHFAGNPDFEGLPKKFKISVEASYQGGRHLIQDLGIVLAAAGTEPHYDLWCAGGLGREPQAGFLLEEKVPESLLLQLIEAVVQIYRDNTPPPKRLKHLLNSIGEEEFRRLLALELTRRPLANLPQVALPPLSGEPEFIEIPVFGGQLPAAKLINLADLAERFCSARLATTTDQNIALPLADPAHAETLRSELAAADFAVHETFSARMRICPGSHECKMGLAATRELGAALQKTLSPAAQSLSWAISGCPNSCSQPQLSDYGIVTVKQQKTEDGERIPLFDLYRRTNENLGQSIAQKLTEDELLAAVRNLV